VGRWWLAGVVAGLDDGGDLFVAYTTSGASLNPALGRFLPIEERTVPTPKKLASSNGGFLLPPGESFAAMMVPFVNGWTSLVEKLGHRAMKRRFLCRSPHRERMNRAVFETSVRQTALMISCMFM